MKGLCYQRKVYLDIDDLYVTGKYGRIIVVVYVPYNKTHYVNLNQLLLKEGYAEARDYRNEFDPDDWMGPLEYVAIKPSPVRSPLPIPGFEFWLAMGGGVVAAMCLSGRRGWDNGLRIKKLPKAIWAKVRSTESLLSAVVPVR